MDDEDFFVIPFAEVKELTCIALPGKARKSKYNIYRNNWNLLK